MFLLRKRILEMSFGPATTFLAPRDVYMRLSVCSFVCGMYVEFDLVATARLCRCWVVVTLYVPDAYCTVAKTKQKTDAH